MLANNASDGSPDRGFGADRGRTRRGRSAGPCPRDEELPDAEELALIHELAQVFMDSSDNLVLQIIRRGLRTQMSHLSPGIPWKSERAKVVPLRKKLDQAIAARDGAGAHEAVYALWSDHRARSVRALADSLDDCDA